MTLLAPRRGGWTSWIDFAAPPPTSAAETGLPEPALALDQPASRRALLSGAALVGLITPRGDADSLTPAPQPPPWRSVPELPPTPYGPPPPTIVPTQDGAPYCPGEVQETLIRLVSRITYGPTYEELYLAQTLGYRNYLERHLLPESIDDSELDARLSEFVTLQDSPRDAVLRTRNSDFTPAAELPRATILRAATSKRQLFERIVEFWTDHFNIHLYKDGCETFKPIDDRDVIRRYALDTFPKLLLASARSPAMLTYLDNAFSYVGAPNQNYARELLELHTLGVGHYAQRDIEEIARCFTGWTINDDDSSPLLGQFVFVPELHDNRKKTVLGHVIPRGGGITDGERVIQILCFDPEFAPITAEFVGRKLLRFLWGYEPPQQLIENVKSAFLNSGGNIKEMIRAALDPAYIHCAQPKLKRPYHFAISALRAIPTYIVSFDYLAYQLDVLGQHPFFWAPPNGYPDSLGYWSGYLLPRWRFGIWLFEEQGETIYYNIDGILNAQTLAEKIEALSLYLFFGNMSDQLRGRLTSYLAENQSSRRRVLETVGLALAAPEYQWY